MTRALYKFYQDFGRMGELHGIFVADMKDVYDVLESETPKVAYFGEVLGKHSEVYCDITEDNVQFITDDDTTIGVVLTHGLESGYNPFDYIEQDED